MVILISGASTGIGKSTAIHLARLGHTVWAGVRSEKSAEDIRRLNVQGLSPVLLDVTDDRSVREAVGRIRKESGVLHALINNAGIVVSGPVEAVSIDEWRRQFEVNVLGQIRLTQLCLPLLRETRGRIVSTSSISGKIAAPFLGPYAASKFALEAISDSLRRELKPQGIFVIVIEPGPIDTPIWRKSRAVNEASEKKYSDELRSIYAEGIAKFKKLIDQSERQAAPVALVIKAIEHALFSRRPRTRYPVGPGIDVASKLAGVLPDRLLDTLIASRK